MSGHLQRTEPSRNYPKGGWEARWRDGRQWRGKTFATKREAERWLANVSVSKDAGTYVDPSRSRTRFSEVADDWRVIAARSLRPKTVLGYESTLRVHVLPYWRDVQVGSIDFDAINRWIGSLSAQHSASVVRGSFKVFRLILGHAVRSKRLTSNPATNIDLPKVPKTEMHFLSPAEVDRLALAIAARPRTSKHDPGRPDRPELGLLVRFAAWTGLRAGEIAALKVKHLSLGTDPCLTVVEAASDVNGKLTFGEPKTAASRRTVPLPAFLVTAIKEHLGDRRLNPESYLFMSEQGGPWRHSNFMGRFWKEAVVRAGLPRTLRFHDLRHTCASILIAEGAHPKQISEWLGHSSITITLDRYGHLFPHLGRALAERLDAAYQASLSVGSEVFALRSLGASP